MTSSFHPQSSSPQSPEPDLTNSLVPPQSLGVESRIQAMQVVFQRIYDNVPWRRTQIIDSGSREEMKQAIYTAARAHKVPVVSSPGALLILGLKHSFTLDELKEAYRSLAKQYHPDLKPGDDNATDRFAEVSAAYQLLLDYLNQQTEIAEDQQTELL